MPAVGGHSDDGGDRSDSHGDRPEGGFAITVKTPAMDIGAHDDSASMRVGFACVIRRFVVLLVTSIQEQNRTFAYDFRCILGCISFHKDRVNCN